MRDKNFTNYMLRRTSFPDFLDYIVAYYSWNSNAASVYDVERKKKELNIFASIRFASVGAVSMWIL